MWNYSVSLTEYTWFPKPSIFRLLYAFYEIIFMFLPQNVRSGKIAGYPTKAWILTTQYCLKLLFAMYHSQNTRGHPHLLKGIHYYIIENGIKQTSCLKTFVVWSGKMAYRSSWLIHYMKLESETKISGGFAILSLLTLNSLWDCYLWLSRLMSLCLLQYV